MRLKTMRRLLAEAVHGNLATPNQGGLVCYSHPPHQLDAPCAEVRPSEADGGYVVFSTFCDFSVALLLRFHLEHSDNPTNFDQIDDWVDALMDLFPINITDGTETVRVSIEQISPPNVYETSGVKTVGFDADLTIQ